MIIIKKVIDMISFKQYVTIHLKGFGLNAIGIFFMLLGLMSLVITFKIGVFIFMAILAIVFVGWGVYKINNIK